MGRLKEIKQNQRVDGGYLINRATYDNTLSQEDTRSQVGTGEDSDSPHSK